MLCPAVPARALFSLSILVSVQIHITVDLGIGDPTASRHGVDLISKARYDFHDQRLVVADDEI